VNGCATTGCSNASRWPRPRGRIGFCDACLTALADARAATILRFADEPRGRFRVRHEVCESVADVSLPMLRKGWVCRLCKLTGLRSQGWVQSSLPRSLEQQEQLLTVAGFRPLAPLTDNAPGDQPVNVECVECGGAQIDSLFGIAEGVRLSWLPCSFCNAARFKPTQETVRSRLEELGLDLLSVWTGDPGAGLEARCRRCGTDRVVSWSALGSGAAPCLRCDGRRLDPEAPHRVYLFEFPRLGPRGLYKVGITHCADDRRLAQHTSAGGRLLQVITVANRAAAFAIEAGVMRKYQPHAPATVGANDLPYGGATECWDTVAGYPDLELWVS
jgi:hypothetical protein